MRLRTYLRLGRVSNLPTVITNVLAAAALSGAALSLRALLPLSIAICFFYVGGMFLNDAFDREVDARERPDRPIPSGEISAREVFAVGFSLLALGVAFVAATSLVVGRALLAPIASSATLGATVVLYDAWHKGNPFSPLVMGACRVLVYVTTAFALAGSLNASVGAGAACLFAYLVGLTYAAKQESRFGATWPLVLLLAPFPYTVSVMRDLAGAAIFVGFLAWTLRAVGLLLARRRDLVPRAVVALIAGVSLLDAVLVVKAGHPLLAAAITVGFAATLTLQRWVRGT